MTVTESIKAARRCGTPLIVVRTADPAATIDSIRAMYNGTPPPMIQWDIARGALGINEAGTEALKKVLDDLQTDQSSTTNVVEFLGFCRMMPAKTIIFTLNIHRLIDETGVAQALWNLRDVYKSDARTVINLCPQITLPAELSQDVMVLDEPLPTASELAAIAEKIFISASLPAPDPATVERIVDCTLGLATFPAEQSMAMSLTREGMNFEELWSRKRSVIEATPGLSVWRGGESFSDIGGCENVKGFLRDLISGEQPPRAVVFIDEIEKAVGGSGDTSGVSQSLTGALLTWMQDKGATGLIFIGPPGAAKSAMAKAVGNAANAPTIQFDLSGMKASLVGESEARMRQGLKVIEAVSQGRALFIATCNRIEALSPELRRRFKFGTFFFDIPTVVERQAIWSIMRKRWNLSDADPIPDDRGWTGAEIGQCCELAYRLRRPVASCASFVVPVSKSAGAEIDRLREQAHGKFISASDPGFYDYRKGSELATAATAERKISFEEVA
jgi:hypothetical protein